MNVPSNNWKGTRVKPDESINETERLHFLLPEPFRYLPLSTWMKLASGDVAMVWAGYNRGRLVFDGTVGHHLKVQVELTPVCALTPSDLTRQIRLGTLWTGVPANTVMVKVKSTLLRTRGSQWSAPLAELQAVLQGTVSNLRVPDVLEDGESLPCPLCGDKVDMVVDWMQEQAVGLCAKCGLGFSYALVWHLADGDVYFNSKPG